MNVCPGQFAQACGPFPSPSPDGPTHWDLGKASSRVTAAWFPPQTLPPNSLSRPPLTEQHNGTFQKVNLQTWRCRARAAGCQPHQSLLQSPCLSLTPPGWSLWATHWLCHHTGSQLLAELSGSPGHEGEGPAPPAEELRGAPACTAWSESAGHVDHAGTPSTLFLHTDWECSRSRGERCCPVNTRTQSSGRTGNPACSTATGSGRPPHPEPADHKPQSSGHAGRGSGPRRLDGPDVKVCVGPQSGVPNRAALQPNSDVKSP